MSRETQEVSMATIFALCFAGLLFVGYQSCEREQLQYQERAALCLSQGGSWVGGSKDICIARKEPTP